MNIFDTGDTIRQINQLLRAPTEPEDNDLALVSQSLDRARNYVITRPDLSPEIAELLGDLCGRLLVLKALVKAYRHE